VGRGQGSGHAGASGADHDHVVVTIESGASWGPHDQNCNRFYRSVRGADPPST